MTLRTNRLERADGSKGVDADYMIDGSAKALGVNALDGSSILSSFNMSSLTDQGTGDYLWAHTSAVINRTPQGSDGGLNVACNPEGDGTRIRSYDTAFQIRDQEMYCTVHGDLV